MPLRWSGLVRDLWSAVNTVDVTGTDPDDNTVEEVYPTGLRFVAVKHAS